MNTLIRLNHKKLVLHSQRKEEKQMDNMKVTDDLEDSFTPIDTVEEEKDSFTPIAREVGESITMSFPDAIREIVRGNRVRRMSWPSVEDHGLLKDGWLEIFTNGGYHVWKVSDGDIEGNDWIIVK
jgi:hypothetical protein